MRPRRESSNEMSRAGEPEHVEQAEADQEEHDSGELGEDRQHESNCPERRESDLARGEADDDSQDQQREGRIANRAQVEVRDEQVGLQPTHLIGLRIEAGSRDGVLEEVVDEVG